MEKELQTVDHKTKTIESDANNRSNEKKGKSENTISPPVKSSQDPDSNPLAHSKIGGNHRDSSVNKDKTNDNTMTFGNQSGMVDEEKNLGGPGKNVLDKGSKMNSKINSKMTSKNSSPQKEVNKPQPKDEEKVTPAKKPVNPLLGN